MPAQTSDGSKSALPRIPWWLGACLFAALALFLLWEEHEAHLLGALPYLLLLACPLIHVLLHGKHGHGGSSRSDHEGGAHSHHSGGAS